MITKIPKFRCPYRALEFAFKHGKLNDHGENIISQNDTCSFRYAYSVLKKRFELGEPVISLDPEISVRYAEEIIKGRFEKAEKTIAETIIQIKESDKTIERNHQYQSTRFDISLLLPLSLSYSAAFDYAKLIGRFKLLEDLLIQLAENDEIYAVACCYYAENIIKGRWEEAEYIFAKYPYLSFCYANEVIKQRFSLGEKVISTDAELSVYYAQFVLKDRFILGEKQIAKNEKWLKQYIKLFHEEKMSEDIHNLMIAKLLTEDELSKEYFQGLKSYKNRMKKMLSKYSENTTVKDILRDINN
jgi:hypothetical protein